MIMLLVALAGGLGAGSRFVLDTMIRWRTSGRYPIGTMIINISGSFLLGLVTGFAVAGLLPDMARIVAGTGFLGGYTTFSTASLETVRLAQQRRYGAALVHATVMLVGSLLAAAAGMAIGLLS